MIPQIMLKMRSGAMNGKSDIKPGIMRTANVAVLLVLIFTAAITAFAWFTNERKLDTITRINSPVALKIGAGAKEDSSGIDMGGIDITDESGKKSFVFCVYSDESVGKYMIQLAHTTNIAFSYTIYAADEGETALPDSVVYVDSSDVSHYYTKSSQLPGGYLNMDAGTGTADGTYHDKTYGEYDSQYVQKNAEPLYWQSSPAIEPASAGKTFTDYYILEVSWDSTKVTNNKETDMVYLTAGMV